MLPGTVPRAGAAPGRSGTRGPAADRLLASLAGDLSTETRAAIAADALAVLAYPELEALFGPHGRAEQPVAGTLGGRPVLGQIDRLAVTPHEVLIVDYKSDRLPPPKVEATPAAYLRQLAIYRALLRAIYPDRPIQAGLLWTTAPRYDRLPDELLDRWAP